MYRKQHNLLMILSKQFTLFIFSGLLALASSSVFALATDREKPINIEADKATIDDVKGIAIYEGNVVITQGTIKIKAAKVTLTYTKKQDLKQVVAVGNPVRFQQTPDGKKPDVHARAQRIEYQANNDTLHLVTEAEVWQAKDKFSGHRIRYNTKNGLIQADKGKKERVKAVITPAR